MDSCLAYMKVSIVENCCCFSLTVISYWTESQVQITVSVLRRKFYN